MPTPAGIFILGELSGPVADRIHAITERADPKLARARRPHLTLAGSSGVGPIAWDTSADELRTRLTPVAAGTAPIEVTLLPPHRFPGTEIVVLPTDPHGPLRQLHDRIAASGLRFGAARFTFSPHVTLNLYRTLTREMYAELMRVRVPEPIRIDAIRAYYTSDPAPARLMVELPLTGDESA